jgi:hypothetical protein
VGLWRIKKGWGIRDDNDRVGIGGLRKGGALEDIERGALEDEERVGHWRIKKGWGIGGQGKAGILWMKKSWGIGG